MSLALEQSTDLLLERRDSASVRTTPSSARALETVLPWTIDSVPDVQVGQLDGEGACQFFRIKSTALPAF
jgi:hypothetical protein